MAIGNICRLPAASIQRFLLVAGNWLGNCFPMQTE